MRIRATSWQQLLSGGVAFDTPPAALAAPGTAGNAAYLLYDNHATAMRDPRGEPLIYVADFLGNLRGIGSGTVGVK